MSDPKIPTVEDRLDNAKSVFALLSMILNAFSQANDIGGAPREMESWAWSRLCSLCESGYQDIAAAYDALSTDMRAAAPDVEVQ